MSKTLSAKYYQENKERLQKKMLAKDIKIFLKKKKKNSARKRYKNLSGDEKQKLVEYKKNIIERGRTLYYNYKKVF